MTGWYTEEGEAFPLGATWIPEEQAYNFALYSKHATGVMLLLYNDRDWARPTAKVPLTHLRNKSGRICSVDLPQYL